MPNTSGKTLHVTAEDVAEDGNGTPAADVTVGSRWVGACNDRVVTAQAVSKG